MKHADMSLSLVAAKFKRPHLPRVALRRETFDILSRAFERRLAVVCAPAGYGKTTMAGAVTAVLDHECLWYRLDALDHDPVVFVRALIEAFRRPFPGFGDVLLERLRADAESSLRTDELLAMFVREADEQVDGRVHLVLDDYHEAAESPALNRAIDYLLASLPPRYHLVVLTRYEPAFSTARLKVAGELSLVDAEALRFDHAQAGAVIASLSGSDPAEDKVTRLVELTEGWPAAIVLAAMTLSWRRLDSLEETLANPRLRQDVYSYLAEQAYRREDASTRTFLTRTCCLEDITPQLAERLTGAEDSAGRLDRLAAKGVFTFPAQPGAYRYHNLFREYLQHRLALDAGERALRQLQMETAEALEEAGRFELAVELFLGLPEPARALKTIARAAESVLEDSRTEQLRTWVSRLRAGGVGRHPWTRLLAGVLSMRDGQDEEAAAEIETAYAEFAGLADCWGMFHAASVRETLAFWLGDAPGAEAWSRTSLDHAQSRRQRAHALISLGAALEQRCDWAGAQQVYEEAAACADDSARDEAARARAHVTNTLAGRGDYRTAMALISATDAFTSAWARPNIRVGWRNTAGMVYLATGDVGAAASYLESALEESERLGFGFYSALILDGLGQLEVARGRYESGRELSLRAAESPALTTDVFSRSFAYCHVGTAWRREGRTREAIDAYERALHAGHAEHAPLPYLNTLANLAFLSQMTTPAARRSLAGVHAEAERLGLQFVTLKCRLFAAILASAHDLPLALGLLGACLTEQIELGHLSFVGQELAAQPDLLREYVLYEERDWLRRAIVRCVAAAPRGHAVLESLDLADGLREELTHTTARGDEPDLLSLPTPPHRPDPFERAGGRGQDAAIPSARAPLQITPREMEVLDLMAGGLRNDEIAARLVLSRHTVKTHVNHIFTKLGVTDRVRAVLIYRESQDP